MKENAQILADRAAEQAILVAHDEMPMRRALVIVIIEEEGTVWSQYTCAAGEGLSWLTEGDRRMLSFEAITELSDFISALPPAANDKCDIST